MDFLANYGLFLLKTVTITICAVLLLVVFVKALRSCQETREGELKVKNLNKHFRLLSEAVEEQVLEPDRFKELQKKRNREEKLRGKHREEKKERKDGKEGKKEKVFVIDFNGDLRASSVDSLREEISALVSVAKKGDEVVLRLESSGGLVHSYGLAAAQLERLKNKGIELTAVVDRIAASGGYMMACVADRVVAAPFALLGSIGVAAVVPNFHRFLENHQIDVEQITAGEYKRTLSLVGKNTDKGRAKFTEQVEEAHELFKSFVARHRKTLDMEKAATGEFWYGLQAKEMGLVDDLATSDDVLLEASKRAQIYKICFDRPKRFSERVGGMMSVVLRSLFRTGVEEARNKTEI